MAIHSNTLAWEIPWRSLAGYSQWSSKEPDTPTTEHAHTHTHTHTHTAAKVVNCCDFAVVVKSVLYTNCKELKE